jgi:hypothetical protein
MPVIPNLSETDRLKRVQGRVVYADYIVQQQAIEQKIKNNAYGGPSGSYNALDVTNRAQDNLYLTETDVSTIKAASYYGIPSVPTNVVATGGNTQATLTWGVPFSGFVPVISYTIVSEPATTTLTSTGPSVTFTGLTNGTSYTFSVSATNKYGTSQFSQASSAVLSAGAPGAPTGITGTVASQQVSLSWTAPSNNGSAITSYTITSSPATTTNTSVTNSFIFTGLTNGTAYTFSITATNAIGTGLAGTSSAITPYTSPTVTTTSLTAVTTTKTLIGSVTTNGGSLITEMGVVWSPTVTNPTIANTKEILTPIVQSGSFTKVFTGATTVYARAYATNAAGTSYGAVFGPT